MGNVKDCPDIIEVPLPAAAAWMSGQLLESNTPPSTWNTPTAEKSGKRVSNRVGSLRVGGHQIPNTLPEGNIPRGSKTQD